MTESSGFRYPWRAAMLAAAGLPALLLMFAATGSAAGGPQH